ncbi:ABC transporter substrate-binding protein [Jiangella mangrovi]|uniref:Raffinose/stachyose/melibiose transport system substrate-binding protein n=1 Tax=Jiangella mangrovi TaxID=1524084 RepID=A0A7W9GS47_9ACTN|nr:extracellular solute-binding protein [Jiangella mangrovi]MBB5788739.1 raffinose/stachyose/melibiose transport system substrate-binding protein [Jiangella mangrovi]
MTTRTHRSTTVAGTALLATLALAACGGSGGDSTGAGDDSGAPSGELRIAVPTSQGPATTAAAEAFEQEYPDVSVDVSTANTDQYQQATRTQLASGTAADVVYVWAGSGGVMSVATLASEGVLADLSEEEWTAGIPEEQRFLTQVDGKTYILPAIYGAVGAIYNQAAFDTAGVTPPQTWTELLAACDTFNDAGIVPMALGLQTPANGQFIDYSLVATTVYAEQPDFGEQMDSGAATFADSGWRDAMEKYLELNEHGCFQENPTGTPADEALRMVSTGEAAMSVQVNSSLPQVQESAPDTEFGLLALPATDDAPATRLPVALTGTFGVTARSENQATAKAFLDFLAENQSIYAEQVSTLPIDPDQAPAEVTPALETVSTFVADGRTAPYPDQTWPNPEVQQTHLQVVQDLFTGSASVDDALGRLQEAFEG